MNATLRFEFDQPGTVLSAIELVGRGIRFCCRQLDGTFVYSVTDAAKAKLMAAHSSTYENSNSQVVPV